jgi:DNA mismatch repair ATPase MutS
MLFTTDKQTLEDLNIFGKHGADSIYNIFNRCSTRGGAAILEEMFRYPLSDDTVINKRVGIIRFFADSGMAFPFDSSLFDGIEPYLANTDERTKLTAQEQSVAKKLGRMIASDTETAVIYKGVQALVALLQGVRSFVASLDKDKEHVYGSECDAIRVIVADTAFASMLASKGKLSHAVIADFDVQLRFRHRDVIQKLLRHLYLLDVYISIAKVAKARGFVFPKALPREQSMARLEGVYHPQVPNAVANDITISPEGNVVFLTGANMAGKSTFMKSLSIAMFLAHMGFPVAAKAMEFSVLDGIYTTINLPDNLGMGASHFYAEVLRTKKMATELKQGKRLFIVFDELFRGTNVKDAYEASIAIIKGFAQKRSSLFVISTHIIEAGEVLRQACSNIRFVYLPTRMNGTHPVYTYTLESGITDDRHGMIIVKNEGILDMLAGGIKKQAHQQAGFIADKQTLEDLNLLGRFKPHSIYSLFNKAKTSGGQRLLEEMFRHPMTDVAVINQRSESFRYFQGLALNFPFHYEGFMVVENYLGSSGAGNIISSTAGIWRKKMMGAFLRDEQYTQLQAGLLATIDALNKLKGLLESVDMALVKKAKEILADKRLSWLALEKGVQELPVLKVAKYDLLLRHTLRQEMEVLLLCLYELDVHIAVSSVARERNFSYAKALPAYEHSIRATALWHPAIDKAVPNAVSPQKDCNVFFLTGANMAGKSTFMKSFGIAVYLAHMGFPVAARDMEFSVRDGLYSSINVADNLNMGYSHFYAEVLRVKTVAEQVSHGKNLIVIFDELFKGTNVKDAYDATLHVSTAFAQYLNCFFIISTHIVEVGEALRNGPHAVQFVYLPTIMEGTVPRYTYRLTEGISSDKHGMVIIGNEKILESLNE